MVLAIDPRTDELRTAALPGKTVVRDRDGSHLFQRGDRSDEGQPVGGLRSEYVQFTYHLYERSHARLVRNEQRKQFEMRMVGGLIRVAVGG